MSVVENYKPSFNNSLRQSKNRNELKLPDKEPSANTFAPRMSKYGQGAFGANLGSSQFDAGKSSVPSPYTNLGSQAPMSYQKNERNPLSTEPKYETRKPDIAADSNMQRSSKAMHGSGSNADDFLGKMLNQDGGQYSNIVGS